MTFSSGVRESRGTVFQEEAWREAWRTQAGLRVRRFRRKASLSSAMPVSQPGSFSRALSARGNQSRRAGNLHILVDTGKVHFRGRPGRFPVVFVYCDKVSNLQREKFRCFSGVARLNIELLVSGERQEALEQKLQFYVDAVTDVLECNRGDWGQGIGYGGGYEIQFAALKRGGRNYTQSAKVSLEVDVSQPLSGG